MGADAVGCGDLVGSSAGSSAGRFAGRSAGSLERWGVSLLEKTPGTGEISDTEEGGCVELMVQRNGWLWRVRWGNKAAGEAMVGIRFAWCLKP